MKTKTAILSKMKLTNCDLLTLICDLHSTLSIEVFNKGKKPTPNQVEAFHLLAKAQQDIKAAVELFETEKA